MTISQIGDEVVEPTPAPVPQVEEGEYQELGCAVDLADGVRVRDSGNHSLNE